MHVILFSKFIILIGIYCLIACSYVVVRMSWIFLEKFDIPM
jgi:hypothetical protein